MKNENCTPSASDPLSLFVTFNKVGRMFGDKCAKTVGRWVETIPSFPKPVRIGCSRLFIREEIDAYIQKLKDKRDQ